MKKRPYQQQFYLGYMDYPGCAFLVAGGETKDPEGVRDAILQEGKRIAEEGMEEAFSNG